MIRRKLKNTVKQYTEAEVLVREATSNDPWGPSSSLMSEIADLTQNSIAFQDIMQMIWKRMNDKQKNWRHVYKSLVLLDYILKTGSPRVAEQCRYNIHAIRTLRDFQYFEEHKDLGMNVREKAKAVLNLLSDDELLNSERERCLKAKARFAKAPTGIGSTTGVRYGHGGTRRPGSRYTSGMGTAGNSGNMYSLRASDSTPDLSRVGRGRTAEVDEVEEELQLQLAMALSKEEHERQMRKKKDEEMKEAAKLKMAMEASLKEDPTSSRDRCHSMSGILDTDPWALPAPPTSSRHAPLPAPPPGHQNNKTNNSPSVPPPAAPAGGVHDPWGGVPSDGGINMRGKEFDPWASGGRTYLGFADKMPNDGFDSKPFNSHSTSSAVPARFDDLLGIDLGSGSKPISSGNNQNTLFDNNLLSTTSGSSGFADVYGFADHSRPSVTNHFSGAGGTGRLVASKSAHDLLTTGFSDNDDDDDVNEIYGMSSNSPQFKSQTPSASQSNTVKDFLSQNKSLVDLDNIVSPPRGIAASKNPFQMTAMSSNKPANPFSSTNAPKPTLNSMAGQGQGNNNAGGFSMNGNVWNSPSSTTTTQIPQSSPAPASLSFHGAFNEANFNTVPHYPTMSQNTAASFNPFL